jgi:hypothetical protein
VYAIIYARNLSSSSSGSGELCGLVVPRLRGLSGASLSGVPKVTKGGSRASLIVLLASLIGALAAFLIRLVSSGLGVVGALCSFLRWLDRRMRPWIGPGGDWSFVLLIFRLHGGE